MSEGVIQMAGNVYSTICPGCNFGCGLYIRENGNLDVDFRKSSPANAGKLCRFGMNLPRFYKPVKSMVDGKETSMEDAAKEAQKRISAGSAAFLSTGNTTCEELLAIQKAGGSYLCTGMNFEAFPPDTHPTLGIGIPYSEIEAAKDIVLFIDPYEQYPLIVRRILSAKKKGAKIRAVWWKDLPLANENIRPSDISKLQLSKESLLISDFHPFSDLEQMKNFLSISRNAGAKITFLKPFANSTGTYLLLKDIKQKSLSQLIDDINKGTIKTLFCLECDPTVLIPQETLSKLTNLIIQTGQASSAKANIVIAHEPIYKKKGTLINNEGRAQSLGGAGTTGLAALGIIAGSAFDFNSLHESMKKIIGVSAIDEFVIPKFERPSYNTVPSSSKPLEAKTALVSVYNPFIWFNLSDDNDFVELNLNTVKTLKLLKSGTIRIKSNGSAVEKKFKVVPVQDNVMLAGNKFGIEKGMITAVEVSR